MHRGVQIYDTCREDDTLEVQLKEGGASIDHQGLVLD